MTPVSSSAAVLPEVVQKPAGRFLSEAECAALAQTVRRYAIGGGETALALETWWQGGLRWGRNQISASLDVRDHRLRVTRRLRGAAGEATTNQVDLTGLEAAVRRAERLLLQEAEDAEWALRSSELEPYEKPVLWFDRTYQQQATEREAVMRAVVQPAEQAGMLATGYLEVSAHGRAFLRPTGEVIYYPYTRAQFSVTVRDPQGTGSGWAGVDWNDWGRIDAAHLVQTALEKCLSSRNPVAVEPGRYTTILEPQAVGDLLMYLMDGDSLGRRENEEKPETYPFGGPQRGTTRIGEPVMDERITITADPMDPDCSFVPIKAPSVICHPATWVERGVLKNLAYNRAYAIEHLLQNTGLPNAHGFHMSGGTTSIPEMIETSRRALLVTRLWGDGPMLDTHSLLVTGYTRDGLWLIENGKITKPVKNMRFIESVLAVLNNVEQLGVPQRVFHPIPDQPVVVPPVKVRDFNFSMLTDAV